MAGVDAAHLFLCRDTVTQFCRGDVNLGWDDPANGDPASGRTAGRRRSPVLNASSTPSLLVTPRIR